MKNFEIKKLRLVKNEQKIRNGTSWDFTLFLINRHCVYSELHVEKFLDNAKISTRLKSRVWFIMEENYQKNMRYTSTSYDDLRFIPQQQKNGSRNRL